MINELPSEVVVREPSSVDIDVFSSASSSDSDEILRALRVRDIPSTSKVTPYTNAPISNQSDIEKVSIHDSSNVTIGPTTVFEGSVVINNFLPGENESRQTNPETVNFGYVRRVENITKVDSENVDDKKERIIPNRSKWKHKSRYIVMGSILSIFVLVTVIVVTISMVTRKADSNVASPNDDTNALNEGNTNKTHLDTFRVITRLEWQAKPPKTPVADLTSPVPNVIIAHTVGQQCFTTLECKYLVRNIQDFHIDKRNFSDISYNFLVAGNGEVYEGRGWNKRGGHSRQFNDRSIGIAFMGNFVDTEPPAAQINATQHFLMEGMKQGKLTTTYKLFGQSQLFNTESPGLALLQIIQRWPHWSDRIDSF